ncbi:MAG: flagellar hook protein FlgE [Nitrospinae bacterium]|nr:flagellar hook protein FlgE [Nitrospinota bacterium]
MSLNSAMYSGVSGILTLGNSMNVIGDNIANVNTIGFKGSRTAFADILSNSMSNGSTTMQMGRGTFLQNVQTSWSQGSFETTANATDMAIQGSGFFVVRDTANSANYYTRSGQFTLDKQGLLVDGTGKVVQGFRVTGTTNGVVSNSGTVANVSLGGVQSQPSATTNFRMGVNLNASASAAATFTTSFDVYNNLGGRTTLTATFTKGAVNATGATWTYALASSSGAVTTGNTGTIQFNSSGQLVSPTTNPTVGITGFTTGANPLTMTWAMFNTTTGAALNEISGYSAPSTTTSIIQDGYSTGTLKGLSVDAKGVISGLFSNGQTQSLYQLELADFPSPWGLSRVGGSLYGETAQSGQPLLGTAGGGGLGTVLGSSLELSNVDLATEFVKMIQNQRGYQANSKIVTSVDEMLTEAVNLKR